MPALALQFLSELGFVLLQHKEHGRFALLSPAPPWFQELWGANDANGGEIPIAEKSPFLENFLFEADALWQSGKSHLCQSEIWIEKSASGVEIPLAAIALQSEGKRLLALHSPESQYHERQQLLQTARNSLLDHEKLQREIQKKEILLHCIIHDLSQPLSVMSVAFDCMTGEPISNRSKDLLELGRKASDQQSLMIRDILQVFAADLQASLDAQSKPGSAPDLLACASSVLNAFVPVYAAKGVQLRINDSAKQRAEWRVRGESTRLQRIFSNLLENALRYSPPGSTVTIGFEEDGEFLKAYVDDEGPGLPADMTPGQIFALFSKGKEGGGKAGLGLYFCRLTVERWGGIISCESRPMRGSRFWFQLPRVSVAAEAPAQPAQPKRAPNKVPLVKKSPMRVLLADDQNEIRILTAHQLERNGHHVVAVANGQEALEALQKESFDVVLLDEDMPVLTGLQTLKTIRERQQELGALVVIALTGYNSEPDRQRLLGAGFDSVIGKPFRLDALEALLQGAAESAAAPANPVPAVSAKSPWENLLDRVAGDEKLAGKMVATFLRDTPPRMAGIEKALTKKNGARLASFAHALKGSVSIFDANAARECAEKLQDLGRANHFSGSARLYSRLKEEIAHLEENLRGYAGQKRSRGPGASPKSQRRSSKPKRKRP
ncbi:MAG TPA: response regulator [Candidatus Sulfotelmatobacter sp.]|nr:response regulator [Candidatus Sulfotelmatobacter sp.]